MGRIAGSLVRRVLGYARNAGDYLTVILNLPTALGYKHCHEAVFDRLREDRCDDIILRRNHPLPC